MNEEANVEVVTEKPEEATSGEKKVLGIDINGILDIMKKNIKWIVIGAVALVVVILLVCLLSGGDRYQRVADAKNLYMPIEEDVLTNLKGQKIECEEDIYDYEHSDDGSLTVVEDADDTLWVVKGKKLVEVDNDIYSYIISIYGNTIVYLKDVQDGEGELYLYDVKKGKSVELSSKAYTDYIVLSPNGKTVAFVENAEIDYDYWYDTTEVISADLMVSKNGKDAEEVESKAFPVAVSDNAKYLYYITDDNKLCMNDEKIESDFTGYKLLFNDDMTELLYYFDGDTKYFRAKKAEDVKVKGESIYSVVIPDNVVKAYAEATGEYDVVYYGIDTFDKSVLNLDGALYYMYDKGEEVEKITSSYNSYQMSEDGKSLLYIDGEDLIYVKNVAKSDKEKKYKDMNADELLASKDLKVIYFINDDDDLCYLKKDKDVKIAGDVYNAVYSDKYGVVYFLDEDELCYANKTKKSVKEVTDDVSGITTMGDFVVFSQDDEACVLTGKKKFKNLED